MLWRILCFTLFSVVCDGFQVSDTKLPNLNKLSPLHSFMDKLTNALSNAFENDKSLGDQINPGVSKKSDPIKMGRNVNLSFLINTSWNISLSFTGIPQKDPTSDLFASRPDSRVAVSNIYITFKEDNLLQLEHHEFLVQDVPGKWALDPDGITLALSLPAVGFERTVKTVGAITSIYGGNDTSQTSSTYFVPSGTCLIQTKVAATDTGRLIINVDNNNGFVYGKDPRNANAGRWSQAPTWSRTGKLIEAAQMS